jgi:hypothetical protein
VRPSNATPLLAAAALLVLFAAGTRGAERPPAAAPTPRLEPKAIELLKAMSARLAAARTLEFTAVSSYESPSRFGARVHHPVRGDGAAAAPINRTRGPLAGTLQGHYSTNSLNVIGFTVSHRF